MQPTKEWIRGSILIWSIFFKDIKDLDASLKFAGLTLDIMAEKLELLMKDQFIVSADKETIYRYEEWLGLEHDSNKSLVDRRKR